MRALSLRADAASTLSRGDFGSPSVERVDGLDGEAFWVEGADREALWVRRGQTLLRVAVRCEERKEAKMTKLRLLVTKSLGRLQN